MLSARCAAHVAKNDFLQLDSAFDHSQQRLRDLRKHQHLFSRGRIFFQIGGGVCLVHNLQLYILGCCSEQDPLQKCIRCGCGVDDEDDVCVAELQPRGHNLTMDQTLINSCQNNIAHVRTSFLSS